ncbi:ADP-ribose/FAD diphosphatase [Gammaproteobacteria bacterium]
MKFCNQCGAPVELRIPPGEHLQRHVCTSCMTIHYQNPKLIVGCIPEWETQVLLCRRAIEPRNGLWTLPAGFMENGETTAQGAARECLEEANARVEMGDLFSLFNLPSIDQVYLIFRARLLDLDFFPGSESCAVALFREEEIPWQELAFSTVRQALKNYFEDRRAESFRLHVCDIYKS